MGYSENCKDLQTRWSQILKKCIPCEMKKIRPGYEFTPNCGLTDYSGPRAPPLQPCPPHSFNNGSRGTCTPCAACPESVERPCSPEADTRCCGDGKHCGKENDLTTFAGPPTFEGPPSAALWVAAIMVAACVMAGLSYFIGKSRRQRFQGRSADGNHKSRSTRSFSAISPVQSVPLRTVLDDLDVLDELIILLDPEGSGVKSTRHLASYCSFPSAWTTYTYSMRDSKSPLKALLEGLTTKHPDWTVGHLARLLGEMGRYDALEVLARLKQTREAV